jgi:hypothetical protein
MSETKVAQAVIETLGKFDRREFKSGMKLKVIHGYMRTVGGKPAPAPQGVCTVTEVGPFVYEGQQPEISVRYKGGGIQSVILLPDSLIEVPAEYAGTLK